MGTAVTNSSGTATQPYTLPATITGGSHSISVAFAGDTSAAPSSGLGTLTVTPVGTTVYVTAASGAPGQTVTLKATLKRATGGAALSGETITFSVDGSVVGTAVTASSGLAGLTYAIPAGDTVGSSHSLTAAFAGDSSNNASSSSGALTISKYSATLSVAAVSSVPGQTVTLSATLKKSGVTALSGETVNFSVDGTLVGTAVTGSSGLAALPFLVPAGEAIGSHSITAAFAGDSSDAAVTGKGALTVKAATTLTVAAVSGARGSAVTVSATLTRAADGTGISGETVSFKVDGKVVGTAATNALGLAGLTYAIPGTAKTGSHSLQDSFAGDAGSSAASGAGTLTVN